MSGAPSDLGEPPISGREVAEGVFKRAAEPDGLLVQADKAFRSWREGGDRRILRPGNVNHVAPGLYETIYRVRLWTAVLLRPDPLAPPRSAPGCLIWGRNNATRGRLTWTATVTVSQHLPHVWGEATGARYAHWQTESRRQDMVRFGVQYVRSAVWHAREGQAVIKAKPSAVWHLMERIRVESRARMTEGLLFEWRRWSERPVSYWQLGDGERYPLDYLIDLLVSEAYYDEQVWTFMGLPVRYWQAVQRGETDAADSRLGRVLDTYRQLLRLDDSRGVDAVADYWRELWGEIADLASDTPDVRHIVAAANFSGGHEVAEPIRLIAIGGVTP